MLPGALLVDLDGVIRRWQGNDAQAEAACGLSRGSILRVAFSTELLLPAISGEVTDEAWRTQVSNELSRLYPGANTNLAVELWSTSPGVVDLEVIATLARCRPGLRIVLATNATSRLPADLAALSLSDRFHAVANSSEIGAAKPSVEFYLAALGLAGVEAAQSLYVDDSRSHVEAAGRLGIVSHHFTTADAMSRFLEEAGAISGDAP